MHAFSLQLINNAGYFYEPEETLDNINFDEQMKQINICAVGPLRVSAAFLNNDLLQKGSKIIMITSQGGSVAWRTTQNPKGHDYGHHVSSMFLRVWYYSLVDGCPFFTAPTTT